MADDAQRGEWFRSNMRYLSYGLASRIDIWRSWSAWCHSRGIEPGGKHTMWKYLLSIGAKNHGRLLARIKML